MLIYIFYCKYCNVSAFVLFIHIICRVHSHPYRCDALGRVIFDRNALSEDESLTDGTLSEDDDVPTIQEAVEDRNHDFKRTHFHSATQCNFCKKKVKYHVQNISVYVFILNYMNVYTIHSLKRLTRHKTW